MRIKKKKKVENQYKDRAEFVGEMDGNQLPIAKMNKKRLDDLTNHNCMIIGECHGGKHRRGTTNGNC